MQLCVSLFALALGPVIVHGGWIRTAKWSAGYAEKTWGLQIKSVDLRLSSHGPDQYQVVLEFGKDLTPEELKSLKESIARTSTAGGAKLEFQFFDGDGVVKCKCNKYIVERSFIGRKGIKGETFVMVLPPDARLVDREWAAKISKVELRKNENEKAPAPPAK